MSAALLLVDLQRSFLDRPGIEPSAGQIVEAARRCLTMFRRRRLPIAHVWMTHGPEHGEPMPHWRATGRRLAPGDADHTVPAPLRPAADEPVFHKQGYSGFANPGLSAWLTDAGVEEVVIAGVQQHACVRHTAMDAYQLGLRVRVARDATGSDDPVHAAITERYLADRGIPFVDLAALARRLDGPPARSEVGETPRALSSAVVAGAPRHDDGPVQSHVSPADVTQRLWQVTVASEASVRAASRAASDAFRCNRALPIPPRTTWLHAAADIVEARRPRLIRALIQDVGKPRAFAEAEVTRSVDLLRTVATHAETWWTLGLGPGWRRRPHGVVAMITPWNNPLAIPVGKLAPALVFGNTVVWKPAPAGLAVALELLDALREAGVPRGAVNLVAGDARVARQLLAAPDVAAATLSGSSLAGHSALAMCARRRLPLQAELGGNNAAILWSDADDLGAAARAIARAAFGFAGQRCTANRRVIVERAALHRVLPSLEKATAELPWGPPDDPQTIIGPMISLGAKERVIRLLQRAAAEGADVRTPHDAGFSHSPSPRVAAGAYLAPRLVVDPAADAEVVQEETFGPVLVVEVVDGWEEALARLNGVRQGLAASLFSHAEARWTAFCEHAEAGILKWNEATAGAGVLAPFGGWKMSGVGPPEHGPANLAFYTRAQAVSPLVPTLEDAPPPITPRNPR